ncbi:MAG: DUF2252 family protein [Nitrososphaera sp.]|jgi:hypothetical protein
MHFDSDGACRSDYNLRSIVQSTLEYEEFLRRSILLVEDDLTLKHIRMRESKFLFFRATYYRWAELFPKLFPKLMDVPRLACVGDVHVENFGTFRNSKGLLEWGINDFDEVDSLPYLNDLLRLSASAIIAISEDKLAITPIKACQAILDGYLRRIRRGSIKPFVLKKRKEPFMTKLARRSFDDPESFWRNMRSLPYAGPKVLPAARARLLKTIVSKASRDGFVLHRRVAGMGSLGHLRFVAIYQGQKKDDSREEPGYCAQELKELGPPATCWQEGRKWDRKVLQRTLEMTDDASRQIAEGWLVRRIAPDCVKLELTMLPAIRKKSLLLCSMGAELGNVHLRANSSRGHLGAIADDLGSRDSEWLYSACKTVVQEITTDWQSFRDKFKA